MSSRRRVCACVHVHVHVCITHTPLPRAAPGARALPLPLPLPLTHTLTRSTCPSLSSRPTYYLLLTTYYLLLTTDYLLQVRGSSSMHSLALGHNPHVIGEATEARGLPP